MLLHTAIDALFIHIMIGSLVWMVIYCRGSLRRVYGAELTGSGNVLDFIGNALITLVLIAGWPVTLSALRKGKLQ